MQNWRKLGVVVFVMSLLSSPLISIYAQDGATTCQLDPADCAVWSAMATVMQNVSSVEIADAQLNLVLDTGSANPTTFAFEGAGLLGESAEIQFSNLHFSGETYDQAVLRQVDDMAYLQLGEAGAWQGASLDQEGISFLDLIDLFSPNGLLWLIEYYGAEPIGQWNREPNISTADGELAVFSIEFKMNELLLSEQFTQGLTPLLTGFGGQQADLDSDTASLFLSILVAQLSDQLRDAPFTVEITTNLETNRMTAMTVHLAAELDFGFISDLMSGSSDSESALEPITLNVDYSAQIVDYDVPLTVTAPDEWLRANFNLDVDFFNLAGNPISNSEVIENPTLQNAEFDIAYGETLTGALSEENAHDYYQFTATSGNIVTLTAASVADDNLLDLYIKLYAEDGELLIENDDALNNREIGLLDAEIYRFSIPADGDYLVEVTWLFAIPEHEYTLTLSVLDE